MTKAKVSTNGAWGKLREVLGYGPRAADTTVAMEALYEVLKLRERLRELGAAIEGQQDNAASSGVAADVDRVVQAMMGSVRTAEALERLAEARRCLFPYLFEQGPNQALRAVDAAVALLGGSVEPTDEGDGIDYARDTLVVDGVEYALAGDQGASLEGTVKRLRAQGLDAFVTPDGCISWRPAEGKSSVVIRNGVELVGPFRSSSADAGWDHVWWWRSRLPERKGQRCRVLVRGAKNSVLVEFEDGETVVTSRYAVRRAKGSEVMG